MPDIRTRGDQFESKDRTVRLYPLGGERPAGNPHDSEVNAHLGKDRASHDAGHQKDDDRTVP
jgi:hypothetical protein